MPRTNVLQATSGQIAVILLAIAVAYARTLAVPFYLDDLSSIRTNPLVYDWQGFEAMWRYGPNRVVGNSTFALNYHFGHFAVAGYHLLNLLIHALAALAVYGGARGLLRTPRLCEGLSELARDYLPVVAALIFALHPLQTGAVTYVVQRLAMIVALFYLIAMASYVQARLAQTARARWGWAGACAASGLLAFFSKENSATLPVAILLVELVFFAPSRRRVLGTAIGAGVALGVFGASVVVGHATDTLPTSSIATLFDATAFSVRLRYFATEQLALLQYLRLFLWPAGLHLDYGWRLVESVQQPAVLLAVLANVSLLALAWPAWRRHPLLAFSILFYYLAHAVESSVFPLVDLVFEHRAYLPNAAACLAAAWLLLVELPRLRGARRWALPVSILLIIVLAVVTMKRNEMWRDPVGLWRHNAEMAPEKSRPRWILGRHLIEAGRVAEGLQAMEHAERLEQVQPSGAETEIYDINMIWALRLSGRFDEALARSARATTRPMRADMRSSFHLNEGSVYFDQQRYRDAEVAYRAALRLVPHSIPAMANLASACAQLGQWAEAESLYARVQRLDRDDRVTRMNLSQVRAQQHLLRAEEFQLQGRLAEGLAAYRAALSELQSAARDNPNDAGLRENVQRLEQAINSLAQRAR